METVLDGISPESEAVEAAAQRVSLLEAAIRIAAVMKYPELSYERTADRIESYDTNPYLLPYGLMSTHVAAFLRAIAVCEQAVSDGQSPLEARELSPRPSYGPPLREVG